MTDLCGRRVFHVTKGDTRLGLLFGPQLRALAEANLELIGVLAPGPWLRSLRPAFLP